MGVARGAITNYRKDRLSSCLTRLQNSRKLKVQKNTVHSGEKRQIGQTNNALYRAQPLMHQGNSCFECRISRLSSWSTNQAIPRTPFTSVDLNLSSSMTVYSVFSVLCSMKICPNQEDTVQYTMSVFQSGHSTTLKASASIAYGQLNG